MKKRLSLFIFIIIMLLLSLHVSFCNSTHSIYLLSSINKQNLTIGDIVKVRGYVYDNGKYKNLKISCYLNGKKYREVKTDENGYFECYVPIKKEGINEIEVIYKGKENEHMVIAYQKANEEKRNNEKEKEEQKENEKNEVMEKNLYVEIIPDSKRIAITNLHGDLLNLYILNHLDHSKIFSVEIEGVDEYYTTGILELKELEEGVIGVYFPPSIENKEITIKIKDEKGKTIWSKKYKIKKYEEKLKNKEKNNAHFNLSFKSFISLLLITTGISLMIISLRMLEKIERF